MYIKRRFNLTHVAEVSAQTFSRSLHTFLDLFDRKKNHNSDFKHEVENEVYNNPF